MRKLVWGGVALLLIAGLAWRAVLASGEAEPQPTVSEIRAERGVPVSVARAELGELAVWRDFNGAVSGVRESVIRARSGDEVAQVAVAVGDRVREGQVVVRQRGDAAEARIRQAEAAARQVQRTAERLRPLWEAGGISDQDWDTAETQLELAMADLAAARDALLLKSPIDGVVTEVAARPGMIPDQGEPLVRVADLSALLVSPRVSSAEAAELRPGQPASAAGGAEGRVRRVALQADPVSRLVEVEIEFPPAAALIPGTLASVRVLVASREDAVVVPAAALRPDGTVWVVGADDIARRRAVTVGLRTRDLAEIADGLRPGEAVVVSGASLLSDGARVRVVDGAGPED